MITRTGMASWCEFSDDANFLLFLETEDVAENSFFKKNLAT